ncbi:MAG TPA: PEP/pyruvate-binding domain-containing protein [Blastocatellia bacterium]|nr:PEP/pyruvate-binding domain-containing protein [Blastocatellia bacterium]
MRTQSFLSALVWLAIAFGSTPSPTSLARQTGQPPQDSVRSNPRSAISVKTTSASVKTIRSLERIDSQADFDQLARVYDRGRFYTLPHMMFVIDRRARGRVYYVNSNAYRFHKDFVNSTYLSLERGRAFYENNYLRPNRRFMLGTIAFQTASGKFTFEFWEGDRLTGELLAEAYASLATSFFAALSFKPNSLAQEELAALLNADRGTAAAVPIPVLTARELAADGQYQPLNLGAGIGQLRILDRVTPETVIDRNQIVIFKEAPVQLTPLSGIITTETASPLSHVNMLAKSWGIPNARIRDADKLFKQLEGKYVRLEVGENAYSLAPADPREVEERNRQWMKRGDLITPRADLAYNRLTDLRSQRARHALRFGAKSANLGEVMNARLPGLGVPPGFAVPFRCYKEFIRLNRLEERIASTVEEDRFVHDPEYRKTQLARIREWIQSGKHHDAFKAKLLAKVHREYAGKGLFARSSTNAEDLPSFSGAGLYTTVPNLRGDERLLEAIKTVWASVWNYEAYEARESFGMNHFGVYPAVLIQEGIDADSAGVVITTDPFNPADRGAVYINAKRGLGIKVVEGKRVAEQIIYRPRSGTVQVLTRSDEDTMLAFDERGGVREVLIEQRRAVLTDHMARRLARAALQIKRLFGGRDQDIEWVYSHERLFIVQSRPYVDGN